jgi:2'-5' RNA ligase
MLNRDLLQQNTARPSLGFKPPDFFSETLPGDAAPADTVFFAVLPPPVTVPCISRLAWHVHDKRRLTGRPLRPGCFHVSLLFAGYHGRMSAPTLEALINAAGTVTMRPFRVSFDWVTSFRHSGKRPLVLRGDDGVGGLICLRDKLIAATIDVAGSIPTARGAFTPHLTLLYDEAEIREEPVEDISWTVSEFFLVRSLYGQSRHITLGRFTLRG